MSGVNTVMEIFVDYALRPLRNVLYALGLYYQNKNMQCTFCNKKDGGRGRFFCMDCFVEICSPCYLRYGSCPLCSGFKNVYENRE
jgi:hypothetical protein